MFLLSDNNIKLKRKFILFLVVFFILYSYFLLISELFIYLEFYSLSAQYREYQYQPPLFFQLIKKFFIANSIFLISVLYIIKIYDLNKCNISYYRECDLISYINKRKFL